MTSQQKSLIILLIFINGLLFCCFFPILVWIANVGGIQTEFQTLVSSAGKPPTPKATATPVASPTKPGPTATIQAGWKLYPIAKDGYAMALPTSWVFQELDAATIDQVTVELKKKNPQLAQVLETQGKQLLASGIKFYAIDSAPASSANNLNTNCNIIRSSQTQVYTMDYLVTMSLKEIEGQLGVSKPVAHKRMQFPTGESEQFHYTLTVTGADNKPVAIALTQYLFAHDKNSYAVTFATAPTLDAKSQPIFESIAKTFRYLP